MRLNKYIAACGVTSRRKADDLIATGKVQVNGEVVREMGLQVGPSDTVHVRGAQIALPEETMIVALNKPRGVTTTVQDKHAEETIIELLPYDFPRLHPVGRLDKDSEGLILMTNDGEFTNELTHPSYAHEKEYYVETAQPISGDVLRILSAGVLLDEGKTPRAQVDRVGENAFTIVLKQGWNRQIRRMVGSVGHRVTLLRRVRVGRLKLGDLAPGEYRIVKKSDIL